MCQPSGVVTREEKPGEQMEFENLMRKTVIDIFLHFLKFLFSSNYIFLFCLRLALLSFVLTLLLALPSLENSRHRLKPRRFSFPMAAHTPCHLLC